MLHDHVSIITAFYLAAGVFDLPAQTIEALTGSSPSIMVVNNERYNRAFISTTLNGNQSGFFKRG